MSYFYQPEILTYPFLEEDEFTHCSKVLRKKEGDIINVLDGKGNLAESRLKHIGKKKAELEILHILKIPKKAFTTHLAIAPTKNQDRIEWLVEKSVELGVDEISFFITSNSERPRINIKRIEKKVVSALKQSKSGYLTKINPPLKFSEFIRENGETEKYIAIVEKGLPYFSDVLKPSGNYLILVGPEGDFTKEESHLCKELGYTKVSLGSTVLRTETAGLMAVHFTNVVNAY